MLKPILIGGLSLTLLFSQGLTHTEAKGKVTKKQAKKTTAFDKNKDGIPDSWENGYKLGLNKDVWKKDADKDGLNNLIEYKLKLNPTKADSDRDKIKDGDEDSDKDGLSNKTELSLKLNPGTTDSDGDKIKDADEDYDNDGLSNKIEISLKLNPRASDSDGDKIKDVDEDTDNDGLSNSSELELNLNPKSADSDHDGKKDGVEDTDKDGIIQVNEVRTFKLRAKTGHKKEIQIDYKKLHNNDFFKIHDKTGKITLEMAKTLVNDLHATPELTADYIANEVKAVFQLDDSYQLDLEIEYYNGHSFKVDKEVKPDDENKDEDQPLTTEPDDDSTSTSQPSTTEPSDDTTTSDQPAVIDDSTTVSD